MDPQPQDVVRTLPVSWKHKELDNSTWDPLKVNPTHWSCCHTTHLILRFLSFPFSKWSWIYKDSQKKKRSKWHHFPPARGWYIWNPRTELVNRSGACPPVCVPSRSIMCLWVTRPGWLLLARSLNLKSAADREVANEALCFFFLNLFSFVLLIFYFIFLMILDRNFIWCAIS